MPTADKSHPTSQAKAQPPADEAPQQAPASAEEKPPEEKVVPKEEVRSLFEGGHRLKKKGAKPEEWIAATRLHNTLCLAQPLTKDLEDKVLGEELVLVQE